MHSRENKLHRILYTWDVAKERSPGNIAICGRIWGSEQTCGGFSLSLKYYGSGEDDMLASDN